MAFFGRKNPDPKSVPQEIIKNLDEPLACAQCPHSQGIFKPRLHSNRKIPIPKKDFCPILKAIISAYLAKIANSGSPTFNFDIDHLTHTLPPTTVTKAQQLGIIFVPSLPDETSINNNPYCKLFTNPDPDPDDEPLNTITHLGATIFIGRNLSEP